MRLVVGFLVLVCFDSLAALGPDPEAVAEVLDRSRSVANAAWWGIDAVDATEALQGATDSGAAEAAD